MSNPLSTLFILSIRVRILLAIVCCLTMAVMVATMISSAATPPSGTLAEATPVLTYDAGPFITANQSPLGLGQVDQGPRCNSNTFPCDSYALTVSLPVGYAALHPNASVKATMYWTDIGGDQSDYDLYVYRGNVTTLDGSVAADYQSAGGANPEVATISPLQDGSNLYTVKIVPYVTSQETVHVRLELLSGSGGTGGFPGFGGPDPTVIGVPRYQNFYAPAGSSAEASNGEFNIGFNPGSGRIMVMNSGPIWRLTPPERLLQAKPECCEALWEDKSSTTTDVGVDPILWTDQVTTNPQSGRVFASNSTAGTNGVYAFSDDDGDTWNPLSASPPNASSDHQTIGSGPYPASLSLLANATNHGHAVYYCAQTFPVGAAACQRSDTYGVSYGPSTLPYTGNGGDPCGGIHGHVHVGPDGTVYLPVRDCSGNAGVVVSSDGGVTWTEHIVPNSATQTHGSDPSVAIGANNTVYFFYVANQTAGPQDPTEGHIHVQVSVDHGANWSKDTDLGATHGIRNAVFPEAVAGDDNRAACGFLGTDRPGDYEGASFPGIWYGFVATTYDAGDTWNVVNVTPNDPVQGVAGIWLGGGSNTNRNLLDFNEITLDDKGRVLFGYDDGCVGDCIGNPTVNSYGARMRVARQIGGKSLFSSNDPNTDTTTALIPKPSCLSGTRDSAASHLTWKSPDNGGSNITGYQILRGTALGGETVLVNNTGNAKTAYDDITANPLVAHYFYVVKAINAIGTGNVSNEVDLTVSVGPPLPGGDSCDGINVVTDPSDDAINPAPGGQGPTDQADITGISFSKSGTDLVVTMTIKNLSLIQSPGTSFTAYHVAWTSSNGTMYATEVDEPDPSGASVFWGEWDPSTNQLTTFNSTTATVTEGANGTIAVIVPLSGIGNPTIPITDPAGTPAVRNPYGVNIAGEGVIGAGLVFNQPMDRAPNTGYGQRWAVCASAGPATHYAITAPANIAPNTPFSASVTALDASNNTATGYTGTAHFISSDGSATLPGDYTFTAGDAGVHAFTVTLQTTGNQTITATDTGTPSITGTATVAVGSGSACASPHSGTLSPSSAELLYCGGPFAVSNPTAPLGNTPPACASGTCDFYNLTISIPPGDTNLYAATVTIGWTNSGSLTTQGATVSDFDLYVYQPDETGTKVGQGGGSTNPEIATFTATSGTYTVYVVPYDVQPDVQFNGTITLAQLAPPASPTPTPSPTPPIEVPGVPRYFNYAAPNGLGTSAGEPSIGVNWKSEKFFNNSLFSNIPNGGTSMFESGTQTLRVTFDDCPSPASNFWEDRSAPNAATSLDPILFTDHGYNHLLPDPFRTFSSQLTGADSLSAFTDDDGENWTPSQGGGIPSGVDHQTFGAGPYNPNSTPAPPPHPLYPNAVYYCSQESVTAFCARSDNGGLTFGPGVPTWTTECGAIHGHVKVAPDGTVYVPNADCTPGQGVAVSTDNGLTWTVRTIPGSFPAKGLEDPSIGIGTDNTVYFGYQNGDGHPHVAVSHDRGLTWVNNTDVGTPFGLRNAVYPAVTAGDSGRAAMAFIGTTEPGDYVAQTNFNTGQGFQGVWHLYIATTFDGGITWTTVDATPNDPVQRGSICDQGTVTCDRTPNDRNLLDFIVADTDKEGRVLVAYADGCIGTCVQGPPNSYSALATIIRQAGGNRLFQEFDPVEPAIPNAPNVSSVVRNNDNSVTLDWQRPDGNGSSVTGYKVYRGTTSGGETLLTTVGNVLTFTDTTATAPGVTYYYQVSALNGSGEGPTCHEFTPTILPPTPPSDPCTAPGVQVVDDTSDSGQNTPPDGRVDLQKLFVSEPFFGAGVNKLVFTLRVTPSSTNAAPPSSQWYIIWNRQNPDPDFDRWYVEMKTDASGAPTFKYGKFGVALNATNPNPNANMPVEMGDADSGSYDPASGEIIITLSNDKVESPPTAIHAGQHLAAINVRTFFGRPDGGAKTQNSASDITGDGDYVLVGNAACQLLTISGHVVDGINGANVPNTTLTLTGPNAAASRTASTGSDGNYSVQGNTSLNYTLTPSKEPTANGLESFDASFVARWVAGLDPAPGTNQRIAADADDDGILTSFDASLIARKVAGLNDTGIVGTWKFNPATRSYSPLSASQTSQDFDAILVGDTSGSWSGSAPAGGAGSNWPALTIGMKQVNSAWQTSQANTSSASQASASDASTVIARTAPQSPTVTIPVNLAHVSGAVNTDVNVPITVTDLTGQGVKAYDLQVTYNPAIVQPATPDPFDKAGTLSSGMVVTPNANNAGHLIISAFQSTDLSGAGVLLYLKFHVVGSPGQSTPLTFEDYTDPNPSPHTAFRFNAGNPQGATTNGSVTVSGPTAAHSTISGRIITGAGNSVGGVVLTLTGSSRTRKAITNSQGDYRFTEVETGGFYTVSPTLANYSFSPANRSFSLVGDKTDAVFTASADATQTANAIDTTEYFVRQQYLDFLGREPDQGGFEYWSDQINQCQGDATCVRSRRIGVSAAFFIEQEFQQTGTFIYDLYKGALGRRPAFAEYSTDRQQVVGGANLDAKKSALAESFVQRAEFTAKYQAATTAESFVDALIQNALQSSGVDLSAQRERYLSAYNGGGNMSQSRGLVVRSLADDASLKQAEYNRAFVLAQYFSYLRREPDDSGYNFWLNVLNSQPSNFRAMVCAFITSNEYQDRFGAVHTHSNADCSGSP
jgi:hypothetical protein